MGNRHIKVNPTVTRAEIAKIAGSVSSVAVEGPVPTASGSSPIDQALAAVAQTQAAQAQAWAQTLAARAADDLAKAEKALAMLEETERQNAASLSRLAGEAGLGGPGTKSV